MTSTGATVELPVGAIPSVKLPGETAGKLTALDATTAFTATDVQTIKAASESFKKNPRIEFSQSDLLKLLSFYEGELQAKEMVIAVLKSEKLKSFIRTRYMSQKLSTPSPQQADLIDPADPYIGLFRDKLAESGNFVTNQSAMSAVQSEQEMRAFVRKQQELLETSLQRQRQTHSQIMQLLKESEAKQHRIMCELEEEKRKHEHDTAQGDDITYGLEIERTRLRQELEAMKLSRKTCEMDLKRAQEQLETERTRQKQIVLFLMAERKKIIMKYIEEGKRSEDLAQILSEEKQRVDTIAEGLEEESKKSLQMEAELEKQSHSFDLERKQLKTSLAAHEKTLKDRDLEISQLKHELNWLRSATQSGGQGSSPARAPQLPLKAIGKVAARVTSTDSSDNPHDGGTTASPMMSSVAKVVQPTATVSSVPVSVPTTGIARFITPAGVAAIHQPHRQISIPTAVTTNVATTDTNSVIGSVASGTTKVTPRKLSTGSINSPTTVTTTSRTGGVGAVVTTSIATSSITNRGVPPPIPPNKPIVPPKREQSTSRLVKPQSVAIDATAIVSVPATVTTTTEQLTTNLVDQCHW